VLALDRSVRHGDGSGLGQRGQRGPRRTEREDVYAAHPQRRRRRGEERHDAVPGTPGGSHAGRLEPAQSGEVYADGQWWEQAEQHCRAQCRPHAPAGRPAEAAQPGAVQRATLPDQAYPHRGRHREVSRIDRSVAPWGEEHITSFSKWMLDFVTSFGSTNVIVGFTVGVFVIEMIRRPSRWLPVFLIAVTVGQTLMSTGIKELLDRVRPTANPIAQPSQANRADVLALRCRLWLSCYDGGAGEQHNTDFLK